MSSEFWAEVHGATVHFPIALTFFAVGCDLAAFVLWKNSMGNALRVCGVLGIVCAALGTIPVVISGLFLTHGNLWGSGPLRLHHLFVWPSVGLLITAMTWRVLARRNFSRATFGTYLTMVLVLAALLGGAGKWGGELLLSSS